MAISWAARTLLDRYGSDPTAVPRQWESMAVEVVLRYGSRSDAEALLPVFLADPTRRKRLVAVFARHGDVRMGERLLEACVDAGRLRDGVPSEVLHAVGYLGCESAQRTAWAHVTGPQCEYDESKDACLGLLHLSCREVQSEIAQALEQHFGAAFFPEFLPVLATKTGDPSWREKLVEWGEEGASTDCNGGLILGVALHGGAAHAGGAARGGDAARAAFIRLLWNPRWEAQGGGTGSDRWAYAGARVLGIGIPQLYGDLVTRLHSDMDTADKRHCLATFTALLHLWVQRTWLGLRMASEPEENSAALCDLLFEWSSPHADDSLMGLADRALGHDDPIIRTLYHLEETLRGAARHELELRAATSR